MIMIMIFFLFVVVLFWVFYMIYVNVIYGYEYVILVNCIFFPLIMYDNDFLIWL